jgi:hypothetical protein
MMSRKFQSGELRHAGGAHRSISGNAAVPVSWHQCPRQGCYNQNSLLECGVGCLKADNGAACLFGQVRYLGATGAGKDLLLNSVRAAPENRQVSTHARQFQDRPLWYPGVSVIEPGDRIMPHRTQKPASINGITIGYGGEPSAFAREIQIIFTRARNKAIADLRKKDFQPVGSDSPTPKPAGAWTKNEDEP